MTQVQYLGYIIDERGVHVDPTKIQVIRDWPAPATLTELYIFLGIANFYRRFVLGFSHITWPLSQVTKVGERKILLVKISIEGIRRIETSPSLCPSAHITKIATTISYQDICL